MKLIITHKHCKGTRFDILGDCPMFRALAEQYPELAVTKVYDGFFEGKDRQQYKFDNSDTGYCRSSCRDLQNKVVDHLEIHFA